MIAMQSKESKRKKDHAKLTETETNFNDLLVRILICFFFDSDEIGDRA